MAIAQQEPIDHSAEARRDTLEQFATLPAGKQAAFLQQAIEQNLRDDPTKLHEAIKATVAEHLLSQQQQAPAVALAAMLQLSPQLAPTGREQAETQQAELAASLTTATAEVKQALQQGASVETVKAQAISSGNVAQAAVVTTVVQEHKEEKQREQVAVADEAHREKIGLTEPEQAKAASQFAGLIPPELRAAIGAAMGGAQQAHDAEVVVATGGKGAPEANKGRS